MSVLSRLPAIVDSVGITPAQLVKVLAEDVAVREGIIAKTKEVQQYWINSAKGTGAPVSDRGPHPVQVGSGEIISPGDYQKSIKIKYERTPILAGIVYTDAPHAHWLEYGSIHNPEYGYAQDTADHFNGAEFTGKK